MSLIQIITGMITATLTHPVLLPLAIITSTFILEDAATMIVGVMVADGDIGMLTAMLSLYAGIILGDFGLYGLGYLAAMHRWARRFVDHDKIAPFRLWLNRELTGVVLSTRFLPGLRLPTYVACGFFGTPFRWFAPPVVIGTSVWTTLLFFGAYLFGYFTEDFLGVWRWPIILVAVVCLFLLGRFNVRRRVQVVREQTEQHERYQNISH